nr:MAG TPA: hypothetical protein [Caudoviricetes sp.]
MAKFISSSLLIRFIFQSLILIIPQLFPISSSAYLISNSKSGYCRASASHIGNGVLRAVSKTIVHSAILSL